MEDVLEVYHRPHDPARPQVCLDEASKQLLSEVRAFAHQAGKARAGRWRVHAPRHRGSFHGLRTAGGPPPRLRARATPPPRRCGGDQDALRRALSGGGENRAGDGSTQHPWHRQSLRGVPAPGSAPSGQAAGNPPLSHTWQLAEHGRDRTSRSSPASAWPSAWTTRNTSPAKWRLGSRLATVLPPASIGALAPPTPASNSNTLTHKHYLVDGLVLQQGSV